MDLNPEKIGLNEFHDLIISLLLLLLLLLYIYIYIYISYYYYLFIIIYLLLLLFLNSRIARTFFNPTFVFLIKSK